MNEQAREVFEELINAVYALQGYIEEQPPSLERDHANRIADAALTAAEAMELTSDVTQSESGAWRTLTDAASPYVWSQGADWAYAE